MAEDQAGERTQPATPRKRSKAREDGNVARSQDLSSSFLLLAAVLCFYFYGASFLKKLADFTVLVLSNIHGFNVSDQNTTAFSLKGGIFTLNLMAPILIAIVFAALAASLIQVGFLLTAKPLTPDLNRLNPINGLKKLVGLRSLAKLAASLFKLSVIGIVLYFVLIGEIDHFFLLLDVNIHQTFAYLGLILFRLSLATALSLFILALFDYAYQRWQHEKDLRMSRQEIKDEMKMMEGDPHVRARRRQVQMQLARQRMMRDVPKADVVVTNPTHLAIAIQYNGNMEAPKVVAKGADFLAQKIRSIAKDEKIPVVEKKSLAQALYRTVEVGEEIPESFWEAVAEILAYVYRIQNRAVPA
ncbi:MAG: flagellar biosynthesis protein FlhB [Planctomycetota bacterium]|jgi:flagellar biosynthetic protein FlhB|nr:flagellar biosynthesis protein FlhB [Planctomycetota bacterium]